MTGCELSLKHTCCRCFGQLPVTVSFLAAIMFAFIASVILLTSSLFSVL